MSQGRWRPILAALLVGCLTGGVAGSLLGGPDGLGRLRDHLYGVSSAPGPQIGIPPKDVDSPGASSGMQAAADDTMAPPAPVSTTSGASPPGGSGPPGGQEARLAPEARTVGRSNADAKPVEPWTLQDADPHVPALSFATVSGHVRQQFPAPVPPLAFAGTPPGSELAAIDGMPFRRASRIVVHAPRNLTAGLRKRALQRLAGSPWSVEDAIASPYTIGETHVRYYHDSDRRAAEELAFLFDAAARDFTNYAPAPAEGLLELWLGGDGAAVGRGGSRVQDRTILQQITTAIRSNFPGRP